MRVKRKRRPTGSVAETSPRIKRKKKSRRTKCPAHHREHVLWNELKDRFTESPRRKESEADKETDPTISHALADRVLTKPLFNLNGTRCLQYYRGRWWLWDQDRYRDFSVTELRPMVAKLLRSILEELDL